MSSPSGYKTQKKVLGSIEGFSSDQTQDKAQFTTIQDVGSDMFALDVVQRPCFQVSTAHAVVSATKRILTHDAIAAKKGDMIRFLTGALTGMVFPVLTVVDTTNSILANIFDTLPSAGDTFELLRFTITRTNALGESLVSVSPTPLLFTRDGADQEVTEDTTDSANDRPLPVKNFGENLVAGDIYAPAISDTLDKTLYTATTKIRKARIVNNSGVNFLIKNSGVQIGCLSKGDKMDFNITLDVGDTLDISAIDEGSGVIVGVFAIVWNVFN